MNHREPLGNRNPHPHRQEKRGHDDGDDEEVDHEKPKSLLPQPYECRHEREDEERLEGHGVKLEHRPVREEEPGNVRRGDSHEDGGVLPGHLTDGLDDEEDKSGDPAPPDHGVRDTGDVLDDTRGVRRRVVKSGGANEQQPGERVRLIVVLGVETDVVVVDVTVVLPQAPSNSVDTVAIARAGCPAATVAAGREYPTGPRRHINHNGDWNKQNKCFDRRQSGTPHEGFPPTRLAKSNGFDDHHPHTERGECIEAAPFDCGRGSEENPGDDQPTAPARSVEVAQDCEEGREDEHREESVEKRGAAHGDSDAVDGDQETGECRGRGGIEQTTCNQHDEKNDDDSGASGRDSPAEWVLGTEQCHSRADQPLPERRMGDEVPDAGERIDGTRGEVGGADPLGFVSEVPHRPRVANVIHLVEDECLGALQIDEPDCRSEHENEAVQNLCENPRRHCAQAGAHSSDAVTNSHKQYGTREWGCAHPRCDPNR